MKNKKSIGQQLEEFTQNNPDYAESKFRARMYDNAEEILEALESAKTLLMALDEHVAIENRSILKAVNATIRKVKGETV